MVHSHTEILHSNDNEWNKAADNKWMNFTKSIKQENPNAKEYILWFYIDKVPKKAKLNYGDTSQHTSYILRRMKEIIIGKRHKEGLDDDNILFLYLSGGLMDVHFLIIHWAIFLYKILKIIFPYCVIHHKNTFLVRFIHRYLLFWYACEEALWFFHSFIYSTHIFEHLLCDTYWFRYWCTSMNKT